MQKDDMHLLVRTVMRQTNLVAVALATMANEVAAVVGTVLRLQLQRQQRQQQDLRLFPPPLSLLLLLPLSLLVSAACAAYVHDKQGTPHTQLHVVRTPQQ